MTGPRTRITSGQNRRSRDFGRIDWAATAEAYQAVSVSSLNLVYQFAYRFQRHVLLRAFVNGDATRAQGRGNLVQQFGAAQSLAGHDQATFEPAAVEFIWQSRDFAWAKDHPFQPGEVEFTIRSFHGFILPSSMHISPESRSGSSDRVGMIWTERCRYNADAPTARSMPAQGSAPYAL